MSTESPPVSRLALRVFKRSNRFLVLLWRRLEGADPTKTEIIFRPIRAQDSRPIQVSKFRIDEPLVDGLTDLNVSQDTVICAVNEEENGLDPKANYYVKVRYGDQEEGIRLTPAGVFPSHEREDRKKNIHLMGWEDEGQTWRKLTAVRGPKGAYFLGVAVVPCPNCGESPVDQSGSG